MILHYSADNLFIEEVNCTELARRFGTPLYVYSQTAMTQAVSRYQDTFAELAPLLCYAVKANGNLAVLRHLVSLGCGFDIVSGGELFKVLAAGGDPGKTIFSGVNKSAAEITYALENNIFCFNIESVFEIDRLDTIAARLHKTAPVSLRINPDIDPQTHPYISTGLHNNKFGISCQEALPAYLYAARKKHLKIIGIDCHIGSQLLDLTPLAAAAAKIFALADTLSQQGIKLSHVDLGGGIGIPYQNDEALPAYSSYAAALAPYFAHRPDLRLILEPGRSVAGPAGILLTRVDTVKAQNGKNFILTDAAMNDLPRPALYGAYHEIIPCRLDGAQAEINGDIVGPVCESGDFLGQNRRLRVKAGDLLAVKDCGAYVASMASNYNARPFAAEVLVNGKEAHLSRRRQSYEQLISNELPL